MIAVQTEAVPDLRFPIERGRGQGDFSHEITPATRNQYPIADRVTKDGSRGNGRGRDQVQRVNYCL